MRLVNPFMENNVIEARGCEVLLYGSLFLSNESRPSAMHLLINALVFILFLYFLTVLRDHKRRRGLPYPPGPPSRPLIGNILDIPKDAPWIGYADMSKKYGMKEVFVTCVRTS